MLAQKIAKNVVWKDTYYFEDVAVYFMHITDHKKFWVKFYYEIWQLWTTVQTCTHVLNSGPPHTKNKKQLQWVSLLLLQCTNEGIFVFWGDIVEQQDVISSHFVYFWWNLSPGNSLASWDAEYLACQENTVERQCDDCYRSRNKIYRW